MQDQNSLQENFRKNFNETKFMSSDSNQKEYQIKITKEIIKIIEQNGFVIFPAVTDEINYKAQIEKIKFAFRKDKFDIDTAPIFSGVEATGAFNYKQVINSEDRIMNSPRNCCLTSGSNIDVFMMKPMKFIEKLVNNLNELLFDRNLFNNFSIEGESEAFKNRFTQRREKDSIFNIDFDNFIYSRIYSEAKSSHQQLHMDFASENFYSGWLEYKKVRKELKITPLSALIFHEGGFITILNNNAEPCIDNILKLYKKGGEPKDNMVYGRTKHFSSFLLQKNIHLNDKQRVVAVNIPKTRTQFVKCNPGEIILFGQHLLHAGAGYKKDNLRSFIYLDLIGVDRLSDSFTAPHNRDIQCLSDTQIIKAGGYRNSKKKEKYIKFG